MAKKASTVKIAAEVYAKRMVTSNSTQKKIAKDTSLLPAERQLKIDQVDRNANYWGKRGVVNAIQFAASMGVSKPRIVGAYYAGAVKGAVKGAVQNLRGK
jgi:hypothetical protein